MLNKALSVGVAFFLASATAYAQSAISLSGGEHDTSLPVEMAADTLVVDQAANKAVFSGNARVAQGTMRLSANKIEVIYSANQSQVQKVVASQNVLFTNGSETAEAQSAIYSVENGNIVMTGSVLLLQGPSAISGNTLTLDLTGKTGIMNGNVKSVFVPKQ
jgi:lipopolysaccharide export system protein LptA